MGRLVIVSNRVGSSLSANDGGLATALLTALERRESVWFGWSGEIVDEPPGPTRIRRDGNLTRMLVDLERSDYDGYYLGFAIVLCGRSSITGSILPSTVGNIGPPING